MTPAPKLPARRSMRRIWRFPMSPTPTCSQAGSPKDESNPSISGPHALCPACSTFLPIKRSAATSARSNTSPRAVLLRIPWFPLAPPRSPTRVKRSRWCSPKPWKSPKTRPSRLASNTRSSRQPEHSIRRGRLNRSLLSRTRNTTIPRSAISRRLMKPLPSKSTSAIQLRLSITTRSNCSRPNASGMARS